MFVVIPAIGQYVPAGAGVWVTAAFVATKYPGVAGVGLVAPLNAT
jgi:hypothetical protein